MSASFVTSSRNVRSIEEVMNRAAEHAKKEEKFSRAGFSFISQAGHILESSCRHRGDETSDDVNCLKCRYNRELKLSELPEMVFARNRLRIDFASSGSIEFNALDALKLVSDDRLPDVQVAPSTVWQKARKDRLTDLKTKHKPFDWTFTTNYRGTIEGCKIEPTDDRIDMERLKRRDEIVFHSSITLFEDELADHGIAQLSARIRVMDAGYFFVLLRFYMRVDNVLIRVCDTRIVGDDNTNFVIREWQRREEKYENLKNVDPEVLLDIDRAWMYLPVVESITEKITAL